MPPPNHNRLKLWFLRRVAVLENESRLRTKLNEARKFDNRWSSLFSLLVIASASWLLVQKMLPQPGPESVFPGSPDSYHEIRDAFLVEAKELPAGKNEIRRTAIRLPDDKSIVSRWLDQREPDAYIWYEFNVDVPSAKFVTGSLGVIIPKIWGNSEVYLDRSLVDFGRDNRPVYALKSLHTAVAIKLVPREGDLHSGIQALYSPAWGNIDLLRTVPSLIEAQHMVVPSAESVQLLGAAIFALIALFSARKPEISRFVWFIVASLMFGRAFVAARDNVTFLHNRLTEFLLIFLATLRSLLVFWFFIEFARYLEKRNQRYLINGSIAAGVIIVLVTGLIRVFLPQHELVQTFQFTQELAFFTVTSLVALEILVYLQVKKVPLRRRVSTLLLYLAVTAHFGLNMIDYWFSPNRVTTEFSHNIGLIFLLIMVITAEFARQEKERDELLENLPKEEQRKINLGRVQGPTSTHVGFLLLIDTVAWSEHQEGLASTDLEWEFQNRVNQFLLQVFHHSETSVLTGTGDGFYFAWEGPPKRETLRTIVLMLDQLLAGPIPLRSLGLQPAGPKTFVEFRAALTFGEYAIGRSRFRDLTRDFATGKPLNRLSQIIGNEKGTLRLLCNPGVMVFSDVPGFQKSTIVDKHGRDRHYFEVSVKFLIDILNDSEGLPGLLAEETPKAA